MSMVIANNISAVNTKRQFATSSRGMSGSMERLSSGYKINTGKDDPSGLLISEQLRSQLAGLQRAQQNTEEAINVMGIAEGALNEMNSILKKMKALAIHSANTGVTSAEQIAADQAEMDSAIQTLDRIAQTTSFSGEKLLNGSKDIAYETLTNVLGTQQNSLLNTRDSTFQQIFKRDGYKVNIGFTGTSAADDATGLGKVDFSQQAMKAYLELDTSKDPDNQAQVDGGKFTQDQAFTLTGSKGSRAFSFKKGDTVANMVQQIQSAADSTGIDAALVFNSDQQIHKTAYGISEASAATGPINQEISINGLVDEFGNPVKLTMRADTPEADALREAMKNAGIDSLNFRVDFASNTTGSPMNLIAIDNDGNEYTIVTGWSGNPFDLANKTNSNTVSTITGDTDVARALSGLTFTSSGTVDGLLSASGDYLTFSTHVIDKIELVNIYGPTDTISSKNSGEMTITNLSGIDFAAIYKTLNDDQRASFLDDYQNGKLTVTAELSGQQNNYDVTLNIVGTGAKNYYSETFKSSALGINNGVTDPAGYTINDSKSAFQNVNILVTDQAGAYWAVDPTTALAANGVAAAVVTNHKATFDIQAGVSLTTNSVSIPTATDTITFNYEDPTGATQTITFKAGTTEWAALSALLGPGMDTMELILEANTGFEMNSATQTYNLKARLGNGQTYDLLGAATINATGVVTGGTPITGGAGTIEGALADILGVAGRAISFTAGSGGQLFGEDLFGYDSYDYNVSAYANPEIIKIADELYLAGKAGHGQVELDISGLDWEALLDYVVSDPSFVQTNLTAFLADLKAGTLKIGFDESAGIAGGLAGGKITIGGSMTYLTLDLTATNLALDENGETDGFVSLSGPFTNSQNWAKDLKIKVSSRAAEFGYQGTRDTVKSVTANAGSGIQSTNGTLTLSANAKSNRSTKYNITNSDTATRIQTGGVATDDGAVRQTGTVAVFNNTLGTDAKGVADGTVKQGVAGVTIDDVVAAASIQYGRNTDGQGRIWVKFLDDNTYELYKDESLSRESLVGTGTSGKEVNAMNNSGLEGLILDLAGSELSKKTGVYISFGGIEGESINTDSKGDTYNGVTYSGSVVGDDSSSAIFNKDLTYITGVELGKNTSDEGKLHLKTVYDHENGTVQVFAYKSQDMLASDLVAQSEIFATRVKNEDYDPNNASKGPEYFDVESMTILLNEVRNSDNTAGTGLGIVLSMDKANFADFDKNVTLTSDITFNNLGARVFAQDYGSDEFIKITQDKGSIFNYYGAAGQNTSKTMIDAGAKGKSVQINGQDATLSVNGQQVTTKGLILKMATQDIQASLIFNQGKVGTTTLAQVGYEVGSIFTKVGALNLDSVDEEDEDSKYAGLSGLLCNAGHVTNESVSNFQNGMQLQLGEGAGDQNRTVVSIKSMTSDNLGKISKGGYWDGTAVWTERNFTMQDVMGGGIASLSSRPTLAMEIIEKAIEDVSGLRAQIGAVQTNLLQTNSNNLSVTIENIQKTESGIRDADMADEMTEFTKFQVLQNAAMSMMSQANQSSQNVLQLLR